MVPDDEPTDSGDDSREQGVEFGDLDRALETHDYPTTRDELVDEYGDHELELGGGSETFGAVLDRLGAETGDDETQRFEDAEEVRQTVFNLVGSDAIGRENYTDRGGTLREEFAEDDGHDDGE